MPIAIRLSGKPRYNSAGTQYKSDVKILEAHADYRIYKSLRELEIDSPIILEAKFTGKRETVHFKNNDVIIDSVSKTQIEVTKVYKGQLKDSIINIYEPGYFPSKNVYSPTEGYNLLNEQGRYIRLLAVLRVWCKSIKLGQGNRIRLKSLDCSPPDRVQEYFIAKLEIMIGGQGNRVR